MRRAMTVSAACVLSAISTAAWTQQARTGTVTTIDRISGIVVIEAIPSGTGDASGGGTNRYKVPSGALEDLHAGDRVSYTFNEAGGSKTIVKIDKK